jgi:hypothetical protein
MTVSAGMIPDAAWAETDELPVAEPSIPEQPPTGNPEAA